ncbi:MAG: dCTP deaminase, partial [Chloroflexi bacterium]|nr:dCTP deaminase [Chloroflexota bacterium]
HGKSGLARLGLSVHFTAPKIDPGFSGRIRLEMFNSGPFVLELQLGMEICVIMVDRLGKAAKQVYQGKFKGQ